MDEASAAKLEELHLGAVSEGEEWLRRALYEIGRDELRVLAAAGGVVTHSNRNWLPVAELRSSLMKVLAVSTEVGCNKKNGIMVPMFFGLFMWDFPYKNEITCVVHGIMVPSFSRPLMCDFPHKNEIIWYWTFFCVQTYAGISVVKYCHTCDLQSHGTDLFGPFLLYCPYKNEITRVIHSIMVLSLFGPFM